ncbi:MAG: hypothetical protein ACE37F_09730 [Nannocystaceae bacterium]|nr:hypothetical protein [bacterium]
MSVQDIHSTPRLFHRWKTALSGLALCCFAALGACDDDDGGAGCSENETQECVCPSGMGAQTCQADGTWGACSCGGDTGVGGGETGDGGGNGNGSGSGNGSGNDSGSTSTQSCCLNGSFYACPDEGAAATCFNDFDPSGCSADPSRNGECGDGGSDDGSTGNGDGGVCSDPGQPCGSHGDCCDSDVLCVDGVCAAACSFDDECVSLCCADLEGGGGACAPASFC